MQTHTQLPEKKAGWLRVVMTVGLLSASIPLVIACNPFSKTTTTTPACQTNNSATVAFMNNSNYGTTQRIVWDGVTKVTLAPGQTSSTYTEAAGYHTMVFYNASTGALACTAATPNIAQCTSHTYSCTG